MENSKFITNDDFDEKDLELDLNDDDEDLILLNNIETIKTTELIATQSASIDKNKASDHTSSTVQNTSTTNKNQSPTNIKLRNELFPDKNDCWTLANQDYITTILNKLDLDSYYIGKYTIQYYFKKFFEYDFLVRIKDDGIRKLPILCVCIKELTRKQHNVAVLLTDGTEDVHATVNNNLVKDNYQYFSIGSVLFLQNVNCLNLSTSKNGYHLNINAQNLFKIYYKQQSQQDDSLLASENDQQDENPLQKVQNIELKQMDVVKVKEQINNFETKFVNFKNFDINSASLSRPLNSISNKSIAPLQTKSSSSTSNNFKKPAPYQIPQRFKDNQVNKSSNSNNVKTFSNSNNKSNVSTSLANIKEPDSNNNKTLTGSRDFKFKKQDTTNQNQNNAHKESNQVILIEDNTTEALANQGNFSPSKFSLVSTQISNSTQSSQRLSEEQFSQLIFGIEDQILNDDDF